MAQRAVGLDQSALDQSPNRDLRYAAKIFCGLSDLHCANRRWISAHMLIGRCQLMITALAVASRNMDRTLTPVERAILCRKDKTTAPGRNFDAGVEKWWAQLIDANGLNGDHLRILSRRGRYALDKTGTEMWARLVKKKNLTANDLRQSIKCGRPTRIKRKKRGDWSGGVTTWGGVRIQFKIIRRRIGDNWQTFTSEECDTVLKQLGGILAFAANLHRRKRELLKQSGNGETIKADSDWVFGNDSRHPSVSKKLRAWRQGQAMTQTEAAKFLKVPIGTYRDWEQGRRTPRGPAFLEISSLHF